MKHTSRWQQWWLNFWPHRWHVRQHVPYFLRMAPEPIRGEVLEVGCGSGWTSRRILATFPQVELTAVDIDHVAIQRLSDVSEQYGRRLKVVQADILKLPFDRHSFDTVLAFEVIGVLGEHDVRLAMRELLRVTRPGGLIGVSQYRVRWGKPQFKKLIEPMWMEEGCEILYHQENGSYDVWVRKSYE